MTNDDIFVYLLPLPTRTREVVTPNDDGTYTIFINERLSNDGQIKAYDHAIKHIKNTDFSKRDVQSIEAEAHGMISSSQFKPMAGDKYIKKLRSLKRKRERIKQEMILNEERINYLQIYGMDNFFEQAEYAHLYGEDL